MTQVFISYSRTDKTFAERLARDLQDAGLSVWIDFRRIKGGEQWREAIFEGILQSEIVVVCLSVSAANSEWVRRELLMARSQHKFVIPLILNDCMEILADYEETRWLQDIQWIDFQDIAYEQVFPQVLTALPSAQREVTNDIDPATIPCPFKGLEAFQQTDANFFFGREDLIRRSLDQLQAKSTTRTEARFLALVGASGSGKSSIARAGLIPAIRSGELRGSANWPIVVFTPGPRPVEAMAARLLPIIGGERLLPEVIQILEQGPQTLHQLTEGLLTQGNGDTRLVLIVDQFEEVFTRASASETAAFLELLHYAVTIESGRTIVILTLRADFFGHLSSFPDFARLFEQDHMVIVTEMSSDNLRRTIEGPAVVVGLVYEQGLPDLILEDIRDQPGTLPLLEYALKELYERRAGRQLTLAAYTEIGGVQRALAQHAEGIFESLNSIERDIMRRLLLRLVEVSETGEATRRQVNRAELTFQNVPDQTVNEIIDRLTAPESRLLTANREISTYEEEHVEPNVHVQVSHEALIREWQRFRQWVEVNEEELRYGSEILKAAQDWERTQRDEAYLLTGSRLRRAESWLEYADSSSIQREFIQSSSIRHAQQLQIDRERDKQELALQRIATRRMRLLAATMTIFLIVATALLIFAFSERGNAQTQAERADVGATQAQTLAIGAATQAAIADEGATAVQMSAYAAGTSASVAETSAAVATIQQGKALNEAGTAEAIKVTADYRADLAQSLRLASASRDAVINDDMSLALALAVEANRIVVDPPAEVKRSLAELTYIPGFQRKLGDLDGPVWDVAFNEQGDIALTVHCSQIGSRGICLESKLILWDIMQAERLRTLAIQPGWVRTAAISPDGTTVVAGLDDGTIRSWDSETGALKNVYHGHTGLVQSINFFSVPGAIYFVSAGYNDGSILSWNTQSTLAQDEISFPRDLQYTWSSAFNSYEYPSTLLVGSDNGQIFANSSVVPFTLLETEAITGDVLSLAFSPDQQTFVAGYSDGTMIWWDLAAGQPLQIIEAHTAPIIDVGFLPDGYTALSTGRDNRFLVWNLATGQLVNEFSLKTETDTIYAADLSPNGEMVITGTASGAVDLWYIASDRLQLLPQSDQAIESVVFDSTNQLAISGSANGNIHYWDIANNILLHTSREHAAAITSLNLSPDGTILASTSLDGQLILWDVITREVIYKLWANATGFQQNSLNVYHTEFSPDGQMVLSSGRDGKIHAWDCSTGELIRTYTGHMGWVRTIAFSPDGEILASGGTDRSVLLWEVTTGTILQMLHGHSGWVESVAFSSDGEKVVSGSQDGIVRLWDVSTGEQVASFIGHSGEVYAVSFSPDGQTVLSGSGDHTLKLWDVATGELLHTFIGHGAPVTDLSFSSDGQTILSSSLDHTTMLWRIDANTVEMLAWTVEHRHIPELTCENRTRFQLEPCEDNIPPANTPIPSLTPTNTSTPDLTRTRFTATLTPTVSPTSVVTSTSIPLSPTPTISADSFFAIVNVPLLNVRTGPEFSFPKIGEISLDEQYPVWGTNNDHSWILINYEQNLLGWVRAEFVTLNVNSELLPIVLTPSDVSDSTLAPTPDKPNLIISHVSIDTTEYQPGELIRIMLTVSNYGVASAGVFDLKTHWSPTDQNTIVVTQGLASGEWAEFEFLGRIMETGETQITLTVDTTEKVDESYESDNQRFVILDIDYPILQRDVVLSDAWNLLNLDDGLPDLYWDGISLKSFDDARIAIIRDTSLDDVHYDLLTAETLDYRNLLMIGDDLASGTYLAILTADNRRGILHINDIQLGGQLSAEFLVYDTP